MNSYEMKALAYRRKENIMRKIMACFLFIILLGGISIVPFLPSVAQAEIRCIPYPPIVPSGYVVMSQVHSDTCSGSGINAWNIEIPTDNMVICQFQGLPSGWVIVAQGNSNSCPGSVPNTWTIRIPTSNMRICLYQAIPSCYACTGQSSYSGDCPDPSGMHNNNSCVIVLSLSSIQAVTPASTSIAAGATQQFRATGNCRDNTTRDVTASIDWSSSNTAFATISNAAGSKGLATALAAGTTTIKATSGSFVKTASLTVTPAPQAPLVSLSVTPRNPSIAPGATQQFTATGTYGNNTTQNLTASATWSSTDTAVAAISNALGSKGLATAVTAGRTSITAASGSITSPAAVLTVTSSQPTPPTPTQPSLRPSLRNLTLTISNKRYPDRFKFDVMYEFYGAKTNHDNTYQIEIKVIPDGVTPTTTSFALPTTLNYTASQGSQVFQGKDYRRFTGTLTVTAPRGRPAGQNPLYGRLSFIVKVTGGPPVKVKPGTVSPMPGTVSISKIILLEQVPYKGSIPPRTECTGPTGAKGDMSPGLGSNPVILGPIWPIGQTTLTLNGTNASATAVGQEVKVDTNPLPGIGARGVKLVRLWYWKDNNYVCDIHWWCEGFSNSKPDRGTYEFRYGIGTSLIRVRVP